jgi:hypothetical protein
MSSRANLEKPQETVQLTLEKPAEMNGVPASVLRPTDECSNQLETAKTAREIERR